MIQLQPGDILAWRVGPGSSWVDRLIGWGEAKTGNGCANGNEYYHVAIVGPDASHYYESAPAGGVQNNLVPVALPENVEVYRFIQPLTPDDLRHMWVYANAQLGKGYNYVGVLTAGFIQVAGKPFCSELVWDICVSAQRVICNWGMCISPDEIVESNVLSRIS